MTCGSQVEPMTGRGFGKTEWGAINRAFKDAKRKGGKFCAGGTCANKAQKCGYVVTGMEVLGKPKSVTLEDDSPGFEAEVRTQGGCACTDWS